MKKILLLILCVPLLGISQKRTLTYAQTNDVEFAKQFKSNLLGLSKDIEFTHYVAKNNFTIKIGDTLTIGDAVMERIGGNYASGDLFSGIYVGNMKGKDINRYKKLSYNYTGTKVIVNSIYVGHKKYDGYKFWKNRKETTLYVSLFVKIPEDGSVLSTVLSKTQRITVLDIEASLENGEIVDPNPKMSRSEAIAKLKESKDLMELGLLSEEEYNKLREQLIPIINGD